MTTAAVVGIGDISALHLAAIQANPEVIAAYLGEPEGPRA